MALEISTARYALGSRAGSFLMNLFFKNRRCAPMQVGLVSTLKVRKRLQFLNWFQFFDFHLVYVNCTLLWWSFVLSHSSLHPLLTLLCIVTVSFCGLSWSMQITGCQC
mmetsp:Transcript_49662/g.103607  ORF Transcript_49662/g.103607 Transcript_49662/m.103607 type:complete len:108 (-) Transcript_49662:624-947(-)